MLHRKGSAKYTNGGRYEGDFKGEHRWGWGRHIFPEGDHYEGQWTDDKIQGAPPLLHQPSAAVSPQSPVSLAG